MSIYTTYSIGFGIACVFLEGAVGHLETRIIKAMSVLIIFLSAAAITEMGSIIIKFLALMIFVPRALLRAAR